MTAPRFAVATLALAVLLFVSLSAADVTGRWTAAFETEVGEQRYTFEFVVKGTQLTGTAKSELLGNNEIQDGKVDDTTISFVENASFEGMPLRISYTGTMTSADEIAFVRNVADLATEKLVARRAK